MNFVDTFDPAILLGDRLGLTLYCMFVEAYLLGEYRDERILYLKFINNFPGEIGKHTPETFGRLIDDIKLRGFDPYTPVYANPDEYSLVDGSHRCAIAIKLGMKEVPYNLRFSDDRTDEAIFREIFTLDEVNLIYQKREEYINRCDPEIVLRCRVREIMRESPGSFQAPFSSLTRTPTIRPYQGFESLRILGKRPSACRMEIYGLKQYIHAEMTTLDIGCNVGFFTMHIAPLVKSVVAFDVDLAYIKIARLVQSYCGIDNCRFTKQSLKGVRPAGQYSFVVSTAIHGWSGMSFGDYVDLLDSCLVPGGVLLFESHELDAENDWPVKRRLLTNRFDLLDFGLIDDVDKSMYASEMREFLILKKRVS
jgi:hypothetical protein